jgi:Heparinase II/III-like protein
LPADYDQRLERACEFAMHCHRPDGEIPALSDSDTGNYSDVLQLAASLLGRSDFLYAATSGKNGTPPAQRYASFPDGGYYIQRSGWGTRDISYRDERFLIFDCGALGDGGHGHYDLLNFELSAGGRPLIVDPGRFTYAENTPNLRRWFKGTAAHNTVCIDHTDQCPYRCGKPKDALPQARLIERCSAPGFDMLCGVAESPSYELIHTRRIFFLADEYWIIHDRLRGDQPHHIDLRFHLPSAAWEKTTIVMAGRQSAVCAPGVALVFHAATVPCIESGWVAPQYGTRLPAPVISVALEKHESADFITLITPEHRPECLPRLSACLDRGDGSDTIAVEVRGVGPTRSATDHLSWGSAVVSHEAAPFACRACAIWWRSEPDDSLTALTACNVQELKWTHNGKREFLSALQPSQWLYWDGASTRVAEKRGNL